MAENEDGQEKSEEPTSKRLTEAREKGDIPRSKEMVTMAILMASAVAPMIFGQQLAERLMGMIRSNFSLERGAIFDINSMFSHLGFSIFNALVGLTGFFAFLLIVALIGPTLLGGWNFSTQALEPKMSRLNFFSGVKRMFSMNALVELLKALAKFLLVGSFAVGVLWMIRNDLLALGRGDVRVMMKDAVELVMWVFLILSSTLIIIATLDVPYQLYEYSKKLKMTLQEIKDEMKNSEGKPEVKGRIRQLQREISQRKMMSEVPKADVVITNPTHYAVALSYDLERSNAPFLVAKGSDFLALKIQEIAKEHDVTIVSAPPLARAIYHSTELDQEIPAGLYVAVAQVLAYVYQLRSYRPGSSKKPKYPEESDLDIPDELRKDE